MSEHRYADLLTRLVQGGISPRRARRILLEFKEHHADIVAERMNFGATPPEAHAEADARIGSDDAFVAGVLARPELHSWMRRRPWAAFALLPLMSFGVTFIASILALLGLFHFIKSKLGVVTETPPAIRWIGDIAAVYFLWVIPIAIAAALGVLATKRRAAPLWPCIGMVLISILGAMTNFSVDLPPQATQMGAGIGIGPVNAWPALSRATFSLVLVMLPYLWWWRSRRRGLDVLS